jgi:hypothetical protein
MGLKKDPGSKASAERAKHAGLKCALCNAAVELTPRGTVSAEWLLPYSHRDPRTQEPCGWCFKKEQVCA